MSRDMKPKRAPAKKKSHGGTLIGLFIGLVLGIVGAAAVVWYINKMPAPFKPQVQPPATAPAPAGASKPGTPESGPALLPGKPGDPAPEKRFQFYDILPGKAEAKVDPSAAPAVPQAVPPAKEGKETKEAIFLQAGSFQNAGDADNQKARLALIGMEAAIQQVMLNDKVWYRVRLGPYSKIDDVNRVRAELAKQSIEATVVKKD
ncbi:MAG: SPOR domain-containing protein [Zoogloeaceae bacterium]|nr:SPOR domain-containing protein [Zoogloeaceae bacterium]